MWSAPKVRRVVRKECLLQILQRFIDISFLKYILLTKPDCTHRQTNTQTDETKYMAGSR